jgi:hypothetical protein
VLEINQNVDSKMKLLDNFDFQTRINLAIIMVGNRHVLDSNYASQTASKI